MRYLRPVAGPTTALVVLAATVVAVVAGAAAGVSVLAGGLVTVAVLGATPALLGPVAAQAPHLSLVAALTFFGTKMLFLLAVAAILTSPSLRDHLDLRAVGIAVAGASVTWVALHVRALATARQVTYDLGDEAG